MSNDTHKNPEIADPYAEELDLADAPCVAGFELREEIGGFIINGKRYALADLED